MQRLFRTANRSRARYAIGVSAIVVAALGAQNALAQEFDTRTRLEDRSRSDLTSPPIRVGSFEIRPTVEASVEAVNNLFASDTIVVDDAILSIRPAISVRDNRPDREIGLNVSTGYQSFLDNNAEDRLQLLARARARFGLGTPTRVFGGATARLNDTSGLRLTEGGNVAQPLLTFSYGGNLGVSQDIGRFTLEAEGRAQLFENSGELVFRGQSIDASIRDNAVYEARTRLGYAINPDRRIYIEGNVGRFEDTNGNVSEFANAPSFLLADRSGNFYSVAGGLQVELTELLSLDANVGYAELSFDDPSRPKLSGVSAEVNAYYSPTRLTRFELQAIRSIDETSNPLFSSFLRTGISISAEHELRRDLILRADAGYTDYDIGSLDSIAGQLEPGDDIRLRLSATHFVTPGIAVRLNAEHFERSGFASGSQQRVLLALTYAF